MDKDQFDILASSVKNFVQNPPPGMERIAKRYAKATRLRKEAQDQVSVMQQQLTAMQQQLQQRLGREAELYEIVVEEINLRNQIEG